jgi:hypothetical protein
MGNEAKCKARIAGKRCEGRALLETSELIFRGEEIRVKIPFAQMRDVKAADGTLFFKTVDGVFCFELGAAAEKWREKILHPKSRLEKMGLAAGTLVRLFGEFDAEFLKELAANRVEAVKGTGAAAALLLEVKDKRSLASVEKHAGKMKGAEALWIVYPKGKKEITENDVIAAGRKAGLKDVKVVGFSPTHTALKFVIPLEKRS